MNEKIILIFWLIVAFIFTFFALKLFIKYASKKGTININQNDTPICPKCGSTTFVSSSKNLSGTGLSFMGTAPQSDLKICTKCGNEGIFPVIKKKYVEEYKKNLKKSI